ncbi:MAG: acyltransferase, partial [Magnetospirillum sp.]
FRSDLFAGVPIFFVISGFLVTKSFYECDGDIGRYIVNRSLRIYPALWVSFIVILVALFIGGAFGFADVLKSSFLKFQLYQFIIGSEFWGGYISGYIYNWDNFYKIYPSGVYWTINVELGFYVLVPIVFSRAIRLRTALANSVILASMVVSLWVGSVASELNSSAPSFNTTGALANEPLPYFWLFLGGSAGYVNWERVRRVFEDRFIPWLAAYIMVGGIVALVFEQPLAALHTLTPLRVVAALMLCGCVLSFAYSYRHLSECLRGNDLSYGIYLYHMPLIFTLRFAGVMGIGILWLVVGCTTIVLAAASWFLIEKPMLRLKSGWAPRQGRGSPIG